VDIQSSLRCALFLLAGAVVYASGAQAADPQPYRVDWASTGNGALDATLKSTSQLESLRSAAPVNPFGLIARARGDIDRLKTVLESFGYYQSEVSIARQVSATGGLARRLGTIAPQRFTHAFTMARMSRFSKTTPPCSPLPLTVTSTMARARSSARITWLGNSTRNTG